MVIEFEYTLADWKEAQRAHLWNLLRGRGGNGGLRTSHLLGWMLFVALAVMLFMLLQKPQTQVSSVTAWDTRDSPSSVSRILLPLVPWLLIFAFIWLMALRQFLGKGSTRSWERQPTLHLRKTLDADADRLIVRDAQVHTELKWTAIVRFAETKNLFLLYNSDFTFYLVPKRSFGSPEAVDEFRRLLEAGVQPPTGGFPVQAVARP